MQGLKPSSARWVVLGLLLVGCSSLPERKPSVLQAGANAVQALFVQRTPEPSPGSAAGLAEEVPLVIPGAAWLEQDLGPLVAAHPTIFYDMRGRGRSAVVLDSKSMSLERDVADLEALRIAQGLPKMSLLGWAYGAQVIARYAIEHPQRVERMVLVGPLPPKREDYWNHYLRGYALRYSQADGQAIEALRAAGTKASDPELYCRRVMEASLRGFVHDEAVLGAMRSSPWVRPNLDPERSAEHAQAILRQLGAWDWTLELARVSAPALVVHGEHELLPLESSQAYAEALPAGRLLVIEGAAHMPWLEQPERFFEAVQSFLGESSERQDSVPNDR